jgi:hypothetical protein
LGGIKGQMIYCWISEDVFNKYFSPSFYDHLTTIHFCITSVSSSAPLSYCTPIRITESHRNLLSRMPRPGFPPCSLHPNRNDHNEGSSVLGCSTLSTARHLPTFRKIFKYNQQDPTLHNGISYYKCYTCFRRFLRPSSIIIIIIVPYNYSSTNTRWYVYSFELLMMGGGTTWNM